MELEDIEKAFGRDNIDFILGSIGNLTCKFHYSLENAIMESIYFAIDNEFLDGYALPFNNLFTEDGVEVDKKTLSQFAKYFSRLIADPEESKRILAGSLVSFENGKQDQERFLQSLRTQANRILIDS